MTLKPKSVLFLLLLTSSLLTGLLSSQVGADSQGDPQVKLFFSPDHTSPFSPTVATSGEDRVFQQGGNIFAQYTGLSTGVDYTRKVRDALGSYVSALQSTFSISSGSSFNDTIALPSNAILSSTSSYSNLLWGAELWRGNVLEDAEPFWVVKLGTFSDNTFTTAKTTFVQGETVFVKGEGWPTNTPIDVDYFSGATKVIDGAPVTSNAQGVFTTSATITASHPVGSWSALAHFGGIDYQASSFTVLSPTTLVVNITSPTAGSVFNRGQTVTIRASITNATGTAVSGATVTANNPTGVTIALPETATAGTYSTQYTILASDPTGAWTITVLATKGALSGSAQVAVTISATLNVSIITPAAGSKFNIGQTTTVKATVTFQDNSAIPATASVTFNKPVSGSVSMSVDASDTSGKTWIGSYAVVSSDVPTDGVLWNIVVSAIFGINSGSSPARNVNLFKTLQVTVSTWSSASFNVAKNSFVRGETVFVKAEVKRQDGTIVSSGTVSFRITGTSVATTPVTMAFSGSLNAWTGSYTLLQTDQIGTQTVTATATDPSGNTGSGAHTIGVEVVVPTVVTTAQSLLQQLKNAVQNADSGLFKNTQMKQALLNKIDALINQVSQGATNGALQKLQHDVKPKVDCGSKNSFLNNCGATQTLSNSLVNWVNQIIEALD